MQIKLAKSLDRLKKLKSKMGIPDDYVPNFDLRDSWNSISPEDWNLLTSKGAEATLSDITIDNDKTLNWKGHKVVLHIYSLRSSYGREANLPKFHVSFCKTLQDMKSRGRYERYVVSQRTTGIFVVNSNNIEREECLSVCQNCLIELDYQSFNQLESSKKRKVVSNFRIPDFFKVYHHGFYKVPNFTDKNARFDKYPDNWNQISADIRWACHWQCQKCNLNLISNKKYLHVHHKDHIRANNSPSNLVALCIECHANEESHGHMKSLPAYKEFQKMMGSLKSSFG